MDHRFPKHVTGVPMKSTKRLLPSEPYNQPHYPVSSKMYSIDREGSLNVLRNKNQVSSKPKFFEIMKHNLSNGAKIVQFASQDKIFKKNFSVKEGEKLLQTSQCYLYTTAGAIAGLLFVSTERVAFCSDRSVATYSTSGKLLKFQYKVSIPLTKIKGVLEAKNMKRPSNSYVELATVDDFSFWFMGFINIKKTLKDTSIRQSVWTTYSIDVEE
uniref:GEM-like protein 4 n=1 Tax=Erigeron canadensis TaxID=72917 RepID=UPI001CB94D5F|nr:GEM-like protein 4 [Erigeron canadensis]